jgi:hypothetical protein
MPLALLQQLLFALCLQIDIAARDSEWVDTAWTVCWEIGM